MENIVETARYTSKFPTAKHLINVNRRPLRAPTTSKIVLSAENAIPNVFAISTATPLPGAPPCIQISLIQIIGRYTGTDVTNDKMSSPPQEWESLELMGA
jgi:hypothetical protein